MRPVAAMSLALGLEAGPSGAGCGAESSSIRTLHQLIGGQLGIKNFLRALGAGDRQPTRIEQAELREHGSLIPVNMLVREFVAAEMHDHHERDLDMPSRRR